MPRFDNSLLNSSSKILIRSWLKLRLGLSFFTRKNLLCEKQNLAKSYLRGTICIRQIQFFIRACCFSWSERSSLEMMLEQACRSRMSSPELLVFSHGTFPFSSSPLFSPQMCMGFKKGWSQLSHICGSGELLFDIQPSIVFLILSLGSLLGDKGFVARHTQGTDWQTQRLLLEQ